MKLAAVLLLSAAPLFLGASDAGAQASVEASLTPLEATRVERALERRFSCLEVMESVTGRSTRLPLPAEHVLCWEDLAP